MAAILLIHTGGTIDMAETENGFAPAGGVVEKAVRKHSPAPDVEVIAPLIDSANATPADWNRIAQSIAANHVAYDGFVVTHGTDTMAYTAAALCFALAGLDKPVILTGSMLPLTVAGNDGERNLADALAAAATAPAGVWLQFAGRLLHGARVRKTHSKAFDAFAAEPADMPPRAAAERLELRTYARQEISVLAVAPGVSGQVIEHAAACCAGLVLRCYGSGTVPESSSLRRALAAAQARQIPVVAVSQCPEGGMAFGTYAAAAILAEHGVIDGRDMTVEAAYAKLAHALSHGQTPAAVRSIIETPQCGEIRPAAS
ncbi:asparaginase [Roseobacteraceae bacterium NS-SX3]